MTMRAYDEDYLQGAQRALGDMLDFAVHVCGFELEKAWEMFLVSDVSRQMEDGNPSYLAGRTGCELFREVLLQAGRPDPKVEDEMYVDRSSEYWTGWALAFYQWYTLRSFSRISRAVPIGDVLDMYTVYHEMDVMQFVCEMNRRLEAYYTETNLKIFRTYAGLSQRELSRLSYVPLRQIQMFEQRQRDINKAGALSVMKLARALSCKSEDLLEI